MNRRKILKAIGAVPITASIGLPLAKAFAQKQGRFNRQVSVRWQGASRSLEALPRSKSPA
jgi:hypothetical protein